MTTRTVTVSGRTYHAALDPLATDVPAEIGLPEPSVGRVGRGYRFTYIIEGEGRFKDLLDHLHLIGWSFAEGDDDMTRAEGRAILKDLHRIEAEVR